MPTEPGSIRTDAKRSESGPPKGSSANHWPVKSSGTGVVSGGGAFMYWTSCPPEKSSLSSTVRVTRVKRGYGGHWAALGAELLSLPFPNVTSCTPRSESWAVDSRV